VPDDKPGEGPFAVVQHAMKQEHKVAVARVVMHGKEQLVMVRPVGDLLAVQVLDYDFQVNKPEAYEDMVPETSADPEEVAMVRKLIETSTAEKFDLAAYKDKHTELLTQLIEAKVEGKEVVAPPTEQHAQVLNLMDALKQSVAQAREKAAPVTEAKPPKKVAPSTAGRAGKAGKRKTP
jgi:DNA end-binding protein Ku